MTVERDADTGCTSAQLPEGLGLVAKEPGLKSWWGTSGVLIVKGEPTLESSLAGLQSGQVGSPIGSLRVLKPREVAAKLPRFGLHEVRQRGSHDQHRYPDGGDTAVRIRSSYDILPT